VTPSDRSAAQVALDAGRATYARLDQIRGPEDAAADIVDLWQSVENAMRAMLGGSSLSGQTLVRELRQRNLLDLEQANALAAFWDARSRVNDVQYRPTLTDVGYARVGYNQLSDAVANPKFNTPLIKQPSDTPKPPPSIEVPTYDRPPADRTGVVKSKTRLSIPLVAGLAAAVVLVGALVYVLFFRLSGYDKAMADAVGVMQSGRPESARAVFTKLAMDYPNEAEPHVFLARLARNDGDMPGARRELETAIRNEPANPLPLREMGLFLLASGDAELARRFLVRAVKIAPNDSAAQGYLGCALIRLNRSEEGQRFLTRAGSGAWSSCAAPAPAPSRPL